MLDLTGMWKAVGGEESRKPSEWMRQMESLRLFESLEKKLNRGRHPRLVNIKKGRYGGTFAHPVIGLAYAKYLSPEFHRTVLHRKQTK